MDQLVRKPEQGTDPESRVLRIRSQLQRDFGIVNYADFLLFEYANSVQIHYGPNVLMCFGYVTISNQVPFRVPCVLFSEIDIFLASVIE